MSLEILSNLNDFTILSTILLFWFVDPEQSELCTALISFLQVMLDPPSSSFQFSPPSPMWIRCKSG